MVLAELAVAQIAAPIIFKLAQWFFKASFQTIAQASAWFSTNLKALWILMVLVSVIFSALVLLAIPVPIKISVAITTIYWAFFIGGSCLVFLPSKLIITGFGMILGIGGSDATTGAGLISKIHGSVTELSKELGNIASDLGAETDRFFLQMVWLFVVIVALLFVFAFFEQEGKRAANVPAAPGAD